MRQWIIHVVKFNGEEENLMRLMRKFSSMAHQDYTTVKGINLVPKKNINPKLFGVIQSYSCDGVAFIGEEPLINELKEIADFHKVNFELQYNSWNAFNFGRLDYYYEEQKESSLLFNEDELIDVEFDDEKEVYIYEDAEFSHKGKLEKYIFESAARMQQIYSQSS